jgi:hypothetical protein
MPEDVLPPPTLYGLKTLEGTNLEAPETRVQDAGSLRAIARRMIIDDEPRSRERALTKGLLDGNAPYNQSKRKASGQGWQANLNFMQGEAAIDSASVPYYQIFSGVKQYLVCKTKWGGNPEETERASQLISEHVHRLLKSWREFDWHMQNCFREQLRWGYAPIVYDAGSSWKFKSIDSKCVMVPMNSASVVDDRLPVLLIVEAFTVSELWDKIRDEGAATEAGWNVLAVKRAIQQAAAGVGNTTTPWSATPWEEWQRRFKNNDLYWSTNGQMVYCYRVLVKEFRKGRDKTAISQFIVSQNPIFDSTSTTSSGSVETENDDAGFLFRHVDRYDSYHKAVQVFFQNTGDGTWHSVRGMAMKGFKHWDVLNRTLCKALDNSFQRSSIVLSTDSVKSSDQTQLMVFSDRTILPPGTKVQQMGFGGDIEGVLAVNRVVDNQLANNLGVYNQRSVSREDGRGEMPTATQVQNQVQKEAMLSAGQISITYTGLDLMGQVTFDKIVESSDDDAVAFRKGLEDAGVPMEALKNMESVIWNRASGYGSSAMRKQDLQALVPFVPSFPESGKLAFNDEVISAFVGVEKIDIFNPRSQLADEDMSIAAAENGALVSLCQQIVSDKQDHVNHLQIHLPEIEKRVDPLHQQMEQGATLDPQELQQTYQYLQMAGPHVEQHLSKIANDPTRAGLARQFQAQIQEYVAFNGKLRRAIMEARREQQIAAMQQQNASALGEMDQAKLQSQQLADKIKVDKWNTDKAIKVDKAQTSSRLSAFTTLHAATLKTAQTKVDIETQKAKASA